MSFKDKTFELIGQNEEVFQDLIKYVDLIETTNKSLNLTGFSGDDLWREGIYQSIVLMNESFEITQGKKMLDIGSGVGFPSVPFLIYKRDFDLFISEPSLKRVAFLEEVKKQLSLKMVFMVQRIEDVKEEETFDLITARAVTSLKNLIEISSRVGAMDAQYSFLKGPKIYDELQESSQIIEELSLRTDIKTVDIMTKNNEIQKHYLFQYSKTKKTPKKYPRTWLLISAK